MFVLVAVVVFATWGQILSVNDAILTSDNPELEPDTPDPRDPVAHDQELYDELYTDEGSGDSANDTNLRDDDLESMYDIDDDGNDKARDYIQYEMFPGAFDPGDPKDPTYFKDPSDLRNPTHFKDPSNLQNPTHFKDSHIIYAHDVEVIKPQLENAEHSGAMKVFVIMPVKSNPTSAPNVNQQQPNANKQQHNGNRQQQPNGNRQQQGKRKLVINRRRQNNKRRPAAVVRPAASFVNRSRPARPGRRRFQVRVNGKKTMKIRVRMNNQRQQKGRRKQGGPNARTTPIYIPGGPAVFNPNAKYPVPIVDTEHGDSLPIVEDTNPESLE